MFLTCEAFLLGLECDNKFLSGLKLVFGLGYDVFWSVFDVVFVAEATF